MRKKILSASLWGIFALSLLSSCRTEDNLVQQNKTQEAKYFSVFVPKAGEKINYANGFAFLMKRYDELHKTNLSGINNNPVLGNLSASTGKTASVFQNTGVYVEFAVRSQTITEENGDKWVVFPKVEGNKIVSLVAAVLSQKETYVSYHTINEGDELYKRNINRFQEALARYQKQRVTLALNASINPMAGSGCSNNGVEYDNCGIPEVVIDVPPRGGGGGGSGFPDGGGSGCLPYDLCLPGNDGGGGGGVGGSSQTIANIDYEQLKDYPCAYEVAQLLPNLENNISTLLKDTFGNNNKTNITFKVDAIESEDPNYIINAATNYPPIEDGKFNATVTLNKEMVQLATQEYITSVMYHEIVHAYLGYEYNILGPSAFEQKYPAMETYVVSSTRKFRFKDDYQHTRYAPFIDRMADSIMDFSVKNNPNSTFTKESAKAIAMGGLFKDLSIAIKQIINDESTSNSHSQGTKCQNN